MAGRDLNENDRKLLAYCLNRRRFVSDIARNIGIDVKNVSVRVNTLQEEGLVEVEMIGNKRYVRTKSGSKIKKYIIEALKIIKEKGSLTPNEFHQIYPWSQVIDDPHGRDKKDALDYIEFGSPPLIEKRIKLSPEGESLLKLKDE